LATKLFQSGKLFDLPVKEICWEITVQKKEALQKSMKFYLDVQIGLIQ